MLNTITAALLALASSVVAAEVKTDHHSPDKRRSPDPSA